MERNLAEDLGMDIVMRLAELAAVIPDGAVSPADANTVKAAATEIKALRAQVTRDDEHYGAAMAMSEKHRMLWVEASQALNRMRDDSTWKDMVIKAADQEMGRLREALRVNALRWGATDTEINAVLHPYKDGQSKD